MLLSPPMPVSVAVEPLELYRSELAVDDISARLVRDQRLHIQGEGSRAGALVARGWALGDLGGTRAVPA